MRINIDYPRLPLQSMPWSDYQPKLVIFLLFSFCPVGHSLYARTWSDDFEDIDYHKIMKSISNIPSFHVMNDTTLILTLCQIANLKHNFTAVRELLFSFIC